MICVLSVHVLLERFMILFFLYNIYKKNSSDETISGTHLNCSHFY